jgi:hypothetical protein
LTALLAGGLAAATAQAPKPRVEARFVPKFEAVAETKLLMEGLALSNYRGLEKLLKDKPADDEAWDFARGQAHLIAETGNLLLLRPPRNTGQENWFRQAIALRDAAATLGRHAADHDYERSRADLLTLAAACNRCHQTFRVNVRIGPQRGPG